jgi:hypothetical protein
MKIVSSLHGISAFRASSDDIAPPNGIVWKDVIAKIATTYKFAGIPAIQPGIASQIQHIFQTGEFESEGEKIAIQSLFLTINGAAIQALTTEQSDLVLDNLISLLDESFGFRIRTSSYKRDCASHVVVQFEKSIESCIAILGTVNELVRNALRTVPLGPFSLKRLAFGKESVGETVTPIQITGLDAVDRMDFIIERRANHPFSENRYYAAAPISTEKLFGLLGEIEKVIT